jgi:hypothetical protein
MSAVRIAVVRAAGKPDRFHVALPEGKETSWTFPTYGDALPHDLVHYVVECAANLRGGFWGRVARGADPARINAAANRKTGSLATKYDGFGGDLAELLLAEALAATDWSSDWRASLTEAAAKIGVPPPALTDDDAAAIRMALDHLRERWRSLLPKGAIHLELDPDAPRRSFSALSA